MLPPFEVIAAAFAIRFSAASAPLVLVTVILPPFSVMAEVFSNAWLLAERAMVWPKLIVVAPLHPPVLVPLNVSVLPTRPAARPPSSVIFPVPATAPVIVAPTVVVALACARVFSRIVLSAAPKVRVFVPVVIV